MGTLERIADALERIANALTPTKGFETPKFTIEPGKRYVYGIKGIQELFNVSHLTAQRYKDGIINGAVFQSGRKIVVDVDKALELFNEAKRMANIGYSEISKKKETDI